MQKLNWGIKEYKNLCQEKVDDDDLIQINYQKYEGKWPVVS